MDWLLDKDVGHVALWDPSAIVMMQGPIRTATYRDDHGNTGVIIRDKWKLTEYDKLRFANGGHIITEDTDGVIRVHCKKMYLKFGKKKFPLPRLPPIIITAQLAVATYCPVCKRFVDIREQIIDYQCEPNIFSDSQILRISGVDTK